MPGPGPTAGAGHGSIMAVATRQLSGSDLQDATEVLSREQMQKLYPMLLPCGPEGEATEKANLWRLPKRSRLLWAWPAFGWYALKYMKIGYMKKFYTDDYPKASLGIIAFSGVLSVLIDAFTDPRMAIWTDTYPSQWGRRRPFIFAASFLVPVVFVLAWVPMVPSGTAASIWFGVFHVLYKLMDTLFVIPHDAWGAQLTPSYQEKTHVWAWKEMCAHFGIFCGMAVFPLIFVTKQCSTTPEDGCIQMPVLALFFGLLFMVCSLRLAWVGREPTLQQLDEATVRETSQTAARVPSIKPGGGFTEEDTLPMLISTYLNLPFRILLISVSAQALGQELPFNVLPYLTEWAVGEKCLAADDMFGYLAGTNIVMGLLMVGPWMLISDYFGKFQSYVCWLIALLIATLPYLLVVRDTGDCSMTYLCFGLTALLGSAYGGSFLIKGVVTDAIDYDELLTGGLRREASYLMAVEFIPKFMMIPGECLPFLLMAHFNYARPTPEDLRPKGCTNDAAGDAMCLAHYSTEVAGAGWCDSDLTCADYLRNGASFVCNGAHDECGVIQNNEVVWVLKLCFTLVPAFFMLLGLFALWWYPSAARRREMQVKVTAAAAEVRQGKTVEDPWRMGSMISPAKHPTENAGALSYFWPSELHALAQGPTIEGGQVLLGNLVPKLLLWVGSFAVLIPIGGWVIFIGLDDLSDDLGASWSPLGLMIVGIGILGVWFHGTRLWAAQELKRGKVMQYEVVAKFNQHCAFTGDERLPEPTE